MSTAYKTAVTIFLGAIILLLAGFINGFPIVYSDTSTYLASGFELETPFDRPMTYGLFLWLTSLNGVSLWTVIFAQGLITSYLIFNLVKLCVPHFKHIHFLHILVVIFLSALTSLSWTVSQLIADIFTPIALMSLVLLAVGSFSRKKKGLLYVIFLFATAMHMSHVTLNVVLIAAVLLLRYLNVFGIKEQIKVSPLIICLGLSLLSILTMGSAVSKSKHGFLMGAMVEHGITKKYLDENCPEKDYAFCAYKDSLPEKAWVFLWDENSPFYKMGGWKATKQEFNQIIYSTLTDPTYILLHIKESIKATADQLVKFKIGDGNGAFLSETRLYERMEQYTHHDMKTYESSLQNSQGLTFLNTYNTVLSGIIILSLLGVIFLLFTLSYLDKTVVAALFILLLGVVVNSWACGTLANAIDRLGSKVIWLVPLIVIIGTISIAHKRRLAQNR